MNKRLPIINAFIRYLFARVVVKTIGVTALAIGLLVVQFTIGTGAVRSGKIKPRWQEEWDKAVAAAKLEGQVNIYINSSIAPVLDAGVFQKAYPEIKVHVGAIGRGSEIGPRILAERRAGKYLADIFISGIPTSYPLVYRAKAFDPIKPALILPEVVDESGWRQGKHRYADPEAEHVFIFQGVPQTGSAYYNTDVVNPKEFKSLWDFVNPKWKGKIEARDISDGGTGSGAMRFYHHPDLGPAFIKRLFGEMGVTLFRDRRLGTDWLGDYPWKNSENGFRKEYA